MRKQEALIVGRNLIKAQSRSCWVPVVEKESEGMSQYFGSPWLDVNDEWPIILGHPAQFVLQLDLAILPKNIQLLIGSVGLLQLFYQPDDRVKIDWGQGDSQLSLVRIVNPSVSVGGFRAQPHINGYPKKKAVYITAWKEREDFPHFQEYDDLSLSEKLENISISSELFDADFAGNKYLALQGDKLGGWPFWTQSADYPVDSCGESMELLYQIDAGSFYDGPHVKAHAKNLFASDGTGHIFVSRNNPSELIFEWATG